MFLSIVYKITSEISARLCYVHQFILVTGVSKVLLDSRIPTCLIEAHRSHKYRLSYIYKYLRIDKGYHTVETIHAVRVIIGTFQKIVHKSQNSGECQTPESTNIVIENYSTLHIHIELYFMSNVKCKIIPSHIMQVITSNIYTKSGILFAPTVYNHQPYLQCYKKRFYQSLYIIDKDHKSFQWNIYRSFCVLFRILGSVHHGRLSNTFFYKNILIIITFLSESITISPNFVIIVL
ncbi:hypothetical protein V1478_001697 [Vespula squamosa]|uniref:Uncharacterized protein n=1 Tax=Vespula squamosa TaxID=30214 RepID=A0ABD2BXW7_VESSQ